MKKLVLALAALCALWTGSAYAGAVIPQAAGGPTAVSDTVRLDIPSGAAYLLPRGRIRIAEILPFISVETWDPQRQTWLITTPSVTPGTELHSTGSNIRLVNSVNTIIGAKVTNVGSGCSSAPTFSVSDGNNAIHATFRAYVGQAVSFTITHAGKYDIPPVIVFDYSQQTPPFKPLDVGVRINNSGVPTAILYDNNNMPSPQGSGSTTGYSGAGINVATLSWTIVRSPGDTQTDDLVMTAAAAGSGQITGVDLLTHGGTVGNNATDSHGTVSGGGCGVAPTFSPIANQYVTSITINDGGLYLNAPSDTGTSTGSNSSTTLNDGGKSWTTNQWAGYFVKVKGGPGAGEVGVVVSNTATALTITQKFPTVAATWSVTPGSVDYEIDQGVTSSSGSNTFASVCTADASLNDEPSRQAAQCNSATITNGVVTAVGHSGIGPGFQYRAFAFVVYNGPVPPVKNASLSPVYGAGDAYVTYQVIGSN